MKRMKCYIYTRVSTSMQVDGYSLDAQKDKLRKYAEFQNMLVAGEYCDEGKSGKNIEGRPEFLRMLRDIESGKDGVSFVLVFKLSRFGRNAADVLTSLQRMQDFGVNLICVEDGIDSSKDSGKLMISVLSAVAEIERENILVQTMEGRRQKAREGKWNGGFAPYGYKLVDGHLQIAEEEAEVIRIIYDKYIHTTMGTARIANWLNEHGYSKVCRHNNKREAFTGSFLIGVLDNPVYCGKLAYGRRHNEKIPGTRNQYHIVKQKDYALYDGIHEPIISEEDWQLAQKQRQQTNKRQLKTHSLDHEHVLSGLLKCPVCGGGMYGNVNRKKKGDGTYYRDYFYYACKHRLHVDGKRCDYHHQWGEEIIDGAVEEIIHKLVNTPAFEQGIREKIGGKPPSSTRRWRPCASSSVSSRAPRTGWASRSTRSISTTRITPARRRTCRSGRTGSTTRSPPSRSASPRCRPAWTTSASAGFPPTTSISSCSTSTSCTTSSPIWRKRPS